MAARRLWGPVPVTHALLRLRQEGYELEASVSHAGKPVTNKQTNEQNRVSQREHGSSESNFFCRFISKSPKSIEYILFLDQFWSNIWCFIVSIPLTIFGSHSHLKWRRVGGSSELQSCYSQGEWHLLVIPLSFCLFIYKTSAWSRSFLVCLIEQRSTTIWPSSWHGIRSLSIHSHRQRTCYYWLTIPNVIWSDFRFSERNTVISGLRLQPSLTVATSPPKKKKKKWVIF